MKELGVANIASGPPPLRWAAVAPATTCSVAPELLACQLVEAGGKIGMDAQRGYERGLKVLQAVSSEL